jgi:hypothetical protein
MWDERYFRMNRRSFLESAAGFGAVLAMPVARAGVAKPNVAPVGETVAIVDARFDAALLAAARLHADTQIDLGIRPDAYRAWRESLCNCLCDEVRGVTTWSDYTLLRSCLERAGYRIAGERIIHGRVTLVDWSVRRRRLT